MKNKIDLVVTRHPGLVEFLREQGLLSDDMRVISHATADDVCGKNVCGVLPHSLSCLCDTFTEVELALPAELRGIELTLDQVKTFSRGLVTYKVNRL